MSQPRTFLLAPSPPPSSRSKPEPASRATSHQSPKSLSPSLQVHSHAEPAGAAKRKRDAELAEPFDQITRYPSKPLASLAMETSIEIPDDSEGAPEISDDLDEQDQSNLRTDGDEAEQDELESDDEEEDEEEEDGKYSLHIEVRLRSHSTVLYDAARRAVGKYITDNFTSLETHTLVPGWQEIKFLADEVDSVYCAECAHPLTLVPIRFVHLHIHIYQLPAEGHDKITALCANLNESSDPNDLETEEGGADAQEGDIAASRLELPSICLEGIWESLIYEEGLKTRLLNYIYSSIVFAEQNVDRSLIAWHRLILLHGPPGTGKTSLCKSLAQKVSIRLSGIYQKTELVEINSHSLFSKWFSESGKLVHSLFAKVEQIAEDLDVFVMVLIDEVESLAGCRSNGASGSEPSDALRAVNALLTALDKLKNRQNVLVLTTSNLTGSIDDAFLDRADVKQFIGLPTSEATYWILRTCLKELIKTGIVRTREFLDYKEAVMTRNELDDRTRVRIGSNSITENAGSIKMTAAERSRHCSVKLLQIAQCATGMSGRSLRRLPLLAHARTAVTRLGSRKLGMEAYLDAMLEAVEEQARSLVKINQPEK